MTKKEVCKLLKVSLPTLNRYMKQGLVYTKNGWFVSFDKRDIKKWQKARIKKHG